MNSIKKFAAHAPVRVRKGKGPTFDLKMLNQEPQALFRLEQLILQRQFRIKRVIHAMGANRKSLPQEILYLIRCQIRARSGQIAGKVASADGGNLPNKVFVPIPDAKETGERVVSGNCIFVQKLFNFPQQ